MTWTVGQLMNRQVVAVRPTSGYKEIARLMVEHHVSALPVVDVVGTEGRLVGVVSEADLLATEGTSPWSRAGDPAASDQTAAALMSSPAITVRADHTVDWAARVMHWKGVKRLPVVDPRGRLVGIVSRSDLLGLCLRSDEAIDQDCLRQVLERLGLGPDAVNVRCTGGVVTLHGQVPSAALASRLVEAVHELTGVVGVDDHLTYPPAQPGSRPGRRQRGGA